MESATMRDFVSAALDAGLGVGPGTMLRISGEFPQRELMYALAEGAYERGARFVRIEYDDVRLARIRVERSREEYVEALSAMVERDSGIYVEEGWSSLRVDGYEDPGAMEGVDQDRLVRMQRVRGRAGRALRDAQMSSRLPWCVMPGPTDAWARAVLGPGAKAEDLWRALLPILRLDRPEPAAELRSHMAALERRAAALGRLGLRSLAFRGPGTDLRVELAPESRWQGGADRTPEGKLFMPNIPTEEVFTTPDFRGTEGVAALTRPVRIRGSVVEGGRLQFRNGEVVDADAERGEASLAALLQTDSGSKRLGEVALVDDSSPIWRSGLVFDSVLLDENAACHIALGSGYVPAFADSEALSETEKEARGFNVSLVHEDLMIGSEEVEVTGVDGGLREIPLIRGGRFVF
ncbi:MAG: aminopeptidase [Treponema sp.]|nr:aminopeptidase [Treponema sp.]